MQSYRYSTKALKIKLNALKDCSFKNRSFVSYFHNTPIFLSFYFIYIVFFIYLPLYFRGIIIKKYIFFMSYP